MKPKVYLLCGLPGSGKSTFCKNLSKQNNTAIYSSDEWIINLFGKDFAHEKFQEYQAIARQKIAESAQRDLSKLKNIVLDFGFWKQKGRKKYIEWAKSLKAEPVIYFFNVDYATLENRLDKRNLEKENKSFIVTRDMLHAFTQEFEAPTSIEAKLIKI